MGSHLPSSKRHRRRQQKGQASSFSNNKNVAIIVSLNRVFRRETPLFQTAKSNPKNQNETPQKRTPIISPSQRWCSMFSVPLSLLISLLNRPAIGTEISQKSNPHFGPNCRDL